MGDIIFLLAGIGIASGVLAKVVLTSRRAWDKPPNNMRPLPPDNAEPANEVVLKPYIDVITDQFPEVLDN